MPTHRQLTLLIPTLVIACACSRQEATPEVEAVAVPTLLRQPAVQQDLGLDATQAGRIGDALAECQESPEERLSDYQCLGPDEERQQAVWETVHAVLTDGQKSRLSELTYQEAVGLALEYRSTWTLLGLSHEQVMQIAEVKKENDAAYEQLLVDMSRIRFASQEAMLDYVDEAKQAANGRLLAVLTAEQVELLESAKGRPLAPIE